MERDAALQKLVHSILPFERRDRRDPRFCGMERMAMSSIDSRAFVRTAAFTVVGLLL